MAINEFASADEAARPDLVLGQLPEIDRIDEYVELWMGALDQALVGDDRIISGWNRQSDDERRQGLRQQIAFAYFTRFPGLVQIHAEESSGQQDQV